MVWLRWWWCDCGGPALILTDAAAMLPPITMANKTTVWYSLYYISKYHIKGASNKRACWAISGPQIARLSLGIEDVNQRLEHLFWNKWTYFVHKYFQQPYNTRNLNRRTSELQHTLYHPDGQSRCPSFSSHFQASEKRIFELPEITYICIMPRGVDPLVDEPLSNWWSVLCNVLRSSIPRPLFWPVIRGVPFAKSFLIQYSININICQNYLFDVDHP